MAKKRKNYINNKDFLYALIEYKKTIKDAELENKPKPQITEYIAECLIELSNRFSRYYKFSGYPFRDEMIGDALENCIRVVEKFDETITENPFGYFTQICYNAFLRRIKKEKEYMYIKFKQYDDFKSSLNTIPKEFKLIFETTQTNDFDEFVNEFIVDYEEKKNLKK